MDIHRLEVFCKVVELRSFTRAAKEMALAQPTVSEHIRWLESTLGEKLLDRIKGDIQPTPAGRLFYQYARNIVHTRDEALAAMRQFKSKMSGSLHIGASTIPGTYLLPRFIGSFRQKHPECRVELKISDTRATVESVAEGALELGVVGAKLANRNVVFEEIVGDELVLAVPADHRWARAGVIQPEELAEEAFISREKGSGTLSVTSHVLQERGFNAGKLKVLASMDTTESVRQGIKAGIGVSILSRRAVEEDVQRGTLAIVKIAGIEFPRALYLAYHKNRRMSPLAAAFHDHLRGMIRAAQGD